MYSVCKSWCNAAYDEVLWYDLNLSDSCINLKNLHKFFRHRCFMNAKSLRICGNLGKCDLNTKIPKNLNNILYIYQLL